MPGDLNITNQKTAGRGKAAEHYGSKPGVAGFKYPEKGGLAKGTAHHLDNVQSVPGSPYPSLSENGGTDD